MADRLGQYRGKRDFDRTPEPAGEERPTGEGSRFVVHEHDATNLHWDLRLERDGTLVSWALPRGIPHDPKHNRLAVHTEDHPLEYLEFSGEIPAGNYGAGDMVIWDSGSYDAEKFRKDEVIATFNGERMSGKYALFQTDGKNWMIHRMDPPLDPTAEAMPETIKPMLAKLGSLPGGDDGFGYEVKWDGVRVVCFSDSGHVRLQNRNLRDCSAQYPEIKPIGRALRSTRAVLDGEVVALDERGKPDFGLLQRRMHLASEAAVRQRRGDTPVTYMIFDLLYLNGHSTTALPYAERRKLLEQLDLDGPGWRVPAAYQAGEGQALLAASKQQGLEGIVAKRLAGSYEPGVRSASWIKIKNHAEQEFVVGGWLPGQGRRGATVGSLALGYYEHGELVYAGNVGTGFTDQMLSSLARLLEPLGTGESPFSGRQPPKETVFVQPQLVARVEFAEWTRQGTIRHPSFKGLLDDRNPQEVVLETAES
jgi:bifunctional non-homologous end joining protein LigD